VQAIDAYGAIQESDVREFNTNFVNPLAGWIQGHVYDASTGESIVDATVSVGATVLNTAMGGYYLGVVAPGSYTVAAAATGYTPQTVSGFVIPEGSVVTRDFGLASGADTDGDGMPDDWEAHYSLDPQVDDAGLDPDSDTYSNLAEYQAGSDPKNPLSYPQTTSVYLKKGFNLIAIPAEVSFVYDLGSWLTVIGDISEIEKVMAYDAANGKYITLIPEEPSNPSVILQGREGLIVYAKQDKEVSFTSLLCSSLDLNQGFNLIGIACPPDNYTAFQFLNALGSTNVTSIQRYSTEKGMFETAGFDQSSNASGIDFSIVAGEGYFIYMKQEVLDFSF
jgi:hypothetical protein